MTCMASISLLGTDATPSVDVMVMDDGRKFASIRFDDGYASVTLPGFDALTATYARALAVALTTAAAELDAQLTEPTVAIQAEAVTF